MTVVKSRGFSASHAIAALHSMGCAKHTTGLGPAEDRGQERRESLALSTGTARRCTEGADSKQVSTLPCVIVSSSCLPTSAAILWDWILMQMILRPPLCPPLAPAAGRHTLPV